MSRSASPMVPSSYESQPSSSTLRVQVDLNRCVGYAQCCFPAPSVFRMYSEEALEFDAAPSSEHADAVHRAAAACPVQAIKVGVAPVPRPAVLRNRDGLKVVVVGASLAGLRGAEAVRQTASDAQITVIGEEPNMPYDRPSLSKAMLLNEVKPNDPGLVSFNEVEADWCLGERAVRLEADRQVVHLANGEARSFDRLLIATGGRARPWPKPDEGNLYGVVTVRSLEDSWELRQLLKAKPARVAVIGGGFIGSEVASVCRSLGLSVTLVEMGIAPLAGALGRTVGMFMLNRQKEQGIDLRTNARVEAIEDDGRGSVSGLRLSTGERIAADVVVVALGAIRNIEWLEGSGLKVDVTGLQVDQYCRVLREDGQPSPNIYAAGDVAQWPDSFFGLEKLGVEHWSNAVAQAQLAGTNIVREQGQLEPYHYLPTFWSSQFGLNIKSVGLPRIADAFQIVQGSLGNNRFAGIYGRKGRVVGAITVNEGRFIEFYADMVREQASFPTTIRPAMGTQPVA